MEALIVVIETYMSHRAPKAKSSRGDGEHSIHRIADNHVDEVELG